jgi:hypothetical protein
LQKTKAQKSVQLATQFMRALCCLLNRKHLTLNGNINVNPSWYIYIVGIIVLGLSYETVKSVLGGEILFVCSVVIYLLVLRQIGDFVSRKWSERKST